MHTISAKKTRTAFQKRLKIDVDGLQPSVKTKRPINTIRTNLGVYYLNRLLLGWTTTWTVRGIGKYIN